MKHRVDLPTNRHIPPDPTYDWYMIKSMSMREPQCARFMEEQMDSLDTYTPQRQIQLPNGGTTPVACIPGYVFVRFPTPPNWALLDLCASAQPKLFKIFSHEESIYEEIVPIYVPFLIKNEEIIRLKEREENGSLNPMSPTLPTLVGKQIRIPHGPFMGHQAKVKAIHGHIAKLRLMSSVLGRAVHLSLPMEDLT